MKSGGGLERTPEGLFQPTGKNWSHGYIILQKFHPQADGERLRPDVRTANVTSVPSAEGIK